MERRLSCSILQEHFASLKAALDAALLTFTNSVDCRFADILLEMSGKEMEIESLKLQLNLSRSEVKSMRKNLRTADFNFARSVTGEQTASGKAQQFSAIEKKKTTNSRHGLVRPVEQNDIQCVVPATAGCPSLPKRYRDLPRSMPGWSVSVSDCGTAILDIEKSVPPEIGPVEVQNCNQDLDATLQNPPNLSPSSEDISKQIFSHSEGEDVKVNNSHFLGTSSEHILYHVKEEIQVCGSGPVKEEQSEMENHLHDQIETPSVESPAQSHLAIDRPGEVQMESSNFTVQEEYSQEEMHMYEEDCIPHYDNRRHHNQETEYSKSFTQNTHLPEQQILHARGKRFICSQCGKTFGYLINLKSHQRTHTGEKTYSCPQCGKTFSRLTYIKIHERIHTGEKPYRCVQCGNSFKQISHLRNHQRIHTGEKPYCCPECGKNFSQSGALKIHRKIHTGEKPYPCIVCGKSFNQSANLKSHLRIHGRGKPIADIHSDLY
ncbi:zinc finger protein 2 homolog [Polypterus senegalus]|uniref:zinc finger protein 2 homolog n=1 Tax=Polypterus senegalus TaxID=55291 RepID=UPI001964212B|nr:zinc finger protein 2 homolog [Polypterus senegalus]